MGFCQSLLISYFLNNLQSINNPIRTIRIEQRKKNLLSVTRFLTKLYLGKRKDEGRTKTHFILNQTVKWQDFVQLAADALKDSSFLWLLQSEFHYRSISKLLSSVSVEMFLVMQNQSKQRAGLFKLIPVRKSFAGPQPLPSEKVIRARNLTMRIEEVFQYNIWVTTKYSLGSFILFLQSGLQRLLIVSEVIKPLPNQKVINKLKCRVPPCDFRRLSRFSVKRTLGCVRNSRIHFRASRPGKGLPSKIDRNSWCSCYITF